MKKNKAIALEFRGVTYRINQRPLIHNLNLTIDSGEVLVLLGRSGSGKTTILKLINQLVEATTGEILINGKLATDWNTIELRRKMGYVIQEIGLFPHFTVEQNIGLIPSLEGWKPKQIKTRVYELLHLVGLDAATFASRYPHELSGGQKQRVGIARALAGNPNILLMDEPFGALDPITRLELQQQFRLWQQQLAKTVVLVTHDLYEAMILADRIALIAQGELVTLATKSEFLQSDHPEALRFLACLDAFRQIL